MYTNVYLSECRLVPIEFIVLKIAKRFPLLRTPNLIGPNYSSERRTIIRPLLPSQPNDSVPPKSHRRSFERSHTHLLTFLLNSIVGKTICIYFYYYYYYYFFSFPLFSLLSSISHFIRLPLTCACKNGIIFLFFLL